MKFTDVDLLVRHFFLTTSLSFCLFSSKSHFEKRRYFEKSVVEIVGIKNFSSNFLNCIHTCFTLYDFGEMLQVPINLHTLCVFSVKVSRLNVGGPPSTFTSSERRKEVTSPRNFDTCVTCIFYAVIVDNTRFITSVGLIYCGRISTSITLSSTKVSPNLVSSSLVTEPSVSFCTSYTVTKLPTLTGSVSPSLVGG